MPTDSTKDKTEGTLDKAIGHVKEAAGTLTGNKALKAAGQADQAKGTLKKKGAAKDLLRKWQANKPVLKGRGTTFRPFSCRYSPEGVEGAFSEGHTRKPA